MSFVNRMRLFFERASSSNNNNGSSTPKGILSDANKSNQGTTNPNTNAHGKSTFISQECVSNENCIGVAQGRLLFDQDLLGPNSKRKKEINGSTLSIQSVSSSKNKIRLFKWKSRSKKSVLSPVNDQDESEDIINSKITDIQCCNDHYSEDPEIVEIRLKDEEKRYDKRTKYKSILGDAPLYQMYTSEFGLDESNRLSLFMDTGNSKENMDPESTLRMSMSMSLSHCGGCPNELVEEHTGQCQFLNSIGPGRKMWADMKRVIETDILESLSSKNRSLYEARFELITSESSYHRSLRVLIDNFYKAPELDCSQTGAVISAYQKQHIFSNILEIEETSEKFLDDLEKEWLRDISLKNICHVVYTHADKKFNPYVSYLRTQHLQLQTVESVLANPQICQLFNRLERDQSCGMLNLHSFLILPMQRITRLRLLVRTVLEHMNEDDPAYVSTLKALSSVEKVLNDCETQKTMMEQKTHILQIFVRLDFNHGVSPVSSGNRVLVKDGQLKLLDSSRNAPAAFRKRKNFSRSRSRIPEAQLYLFSDILLIARLKKDNRYLVEDTCPRGALFVSAQDAQLPSNSCSPMENNAEDEIETYYNMKETNRGTSFRMVLLEGTKGRTEYKFEASSVEECTEWLDVLKPRKFENNERYYETWDHPTHIVTKSYNSQQEDELTLCETDIVDIYRKLPKGCYKGVMRDGREGWFPIGYSIEIENEHVRRRNAKILLYYEEKEKRRKQMDN